MNENKPTWFLIFTVFAIACILIACVSVIVFGDSCQSQSCGAETMPTVVANSEYIWENDDEIGRLIREADIPKVPEKTNVDILHAKICKTTSKSPLCEDIEILRRIDSIAKEKWVPTGLIIGIMFAESTLATNYNKPICKTRNNPYGIKGRKYDNGKTVMYNNGRGRDSDGCYLYPFASLDEATYSLANSISIGYKGCKNDVVCLSYRYVWDPEKSEVSWVNRVNTFALVK